MTFTQSEMFLISIVVALVGYVVGRFDKRITRLENEFDTLIDKLQCFHKEDK